MPNPMKAARPSKARHPRLKYETMSRKRLVALAQRGNVRARNELRRRRGSTRQRAPNQARETIATMTGAAMALPLTGVVVSTAARI